MSWALVVSAVGTLALVTTCVLVVLLIAGRRAVARELDASRADVDTLRRRLEEMSSGMEELRAASAAADPLGPAGYVITDVAAQGESRDEPADSRVVLSATLGEPLVKVAAFAYGVRRALSAENRNRIAFEMRREVKRARKQRRRDLRVSRRAAQAREREAVMEEDAA